MRCSAPPPEGLLSYHIVSELTVTLFGHPYCHLCAEMQVALEALAQPLGFELQLVDIEGVAHLEEEFGDFVPVLYCADERVCHYYLDEGKLRASLIRAREIGK